MPAPDLSRQNSAAADDAGGSTAQRTTWHHPRLSRVRNALLVLLPLGLAAGLLPWPPLVTFILNFFAMVPLALFIAASTRRLAESAPPNFSGLLKVILGNIVEIIIGINAVIQGQIELAQSSLIGSIVLYSLLVLGSCFLVVGFDKSRLDFGTLVMKVTASLMMVSSISLIMPTTVSSALLLSDYPEASRDRNILILSYGTSIALLILFMVYMYFRLKTHAYLFVEGRHDGNAANSDDHNVTGVETQTALGTWAAGGMLTVAILCTIGCSYYLVSSVDGLAETSRVHKTFVGLVIIPFVGSTAQGLKIVLGSRDIGIKSAVNIVVTSVLHIALLATPLLVLVGWIIRQPMTLDLGIFEATVLFLVIMVMNSVIQEGKATYFEGGMLIGTYVVIAVSIYVRPDSEDAITAKLLLS